MLSLPNSGNEALYNLYVKDNATGKTFTLVPAIAETGQQKVYAAWGSYVLSGGETPAYTFCNLPVGNYTVGVQAVSYNYSASAFTTAECAVETGIDAVETEKNQGIQYFTIDGRRAASNAKGLLLMRDGNKVTKVIK
ncbi:MAG: hypothetical protein ACI3YM_00420 [Prevotella sp.]